MTTSRAARSPSGRVPSVLVGLAAVALLVGCTSAPEPAPTPTPAPEATGPVGLTPDSSVDEARVVFDRTVQALLEGDGVPGGRDVVDALVAAGFDKGSLQVTPDSTWTDRGADSVQFSALWAGSCLVGQVAGDSYAAQTAPVLGTGACLVGTTRAIDW